MDLKKIAENMNIADNFTMPYATKNKDAIRFNDEKDDIRPAYFRDTDRIIHSLAFSRYIDKTQVFTNTHNDHVTKRMIHVQLVSKIARTIGRALGLNEDLIEAASLGHDLGHTPFGHPGEAILNEISLKYNEGFFHHNLQSVRLLMDLEREGKGLNITMQTLDAIMCHNGEFVLGKYAPVNKTKEDFLHEYETAWFDESVVEHLKPMTLEGCVVRISDIIAYLGRDIEDAVRLHVFDKNLIPDQIANILGTTNKEIVNTIINDVISNSLGNNYIELSSDVYEAIKLLKKFNYEHIYYPSLTLEERATMKEQFYTLFDYYLKDVQTRNEGSPIYYQFLKHKNKKYQDNTTDVKKVIDYIAGMTDDFFLKSYEGIIK